MIKIKPLNIVLGITGLLVTLFGIQAVMSSNTSFNTEEARTQAFVELVRAEFPDASKSFSDEALVVHSIDICSKVVQGVGYGDLIDDLTISMSVDLKIPQAEIDSDFAVYFVNLSAITRCLEVSETVIN